MSKNLDSIKEAKFIELNYKPSYILIGVIYRPPNNNYNLFEEKLSGILELINREKRFLNGMI